MSALPRPQTLPSAISPEKGLVQPFALGRDDVLVAHQHDRAFVAVSLPAEEQVAVDLGLFQALVHEREELREQRVEGEELLPLHRAAARDGFDLHHARELFRIERLALRLPAGFPFRAPRATQ